MLRKCFVENTGFNILRCFLCWFPTVATNPSPNTIELVLSITEISVELGMQLGQILRTQ